MRDFGVAVEIDDGEFAANATCVAGVVQIYRFNNSVANMCVCVCVA